MFKTVKNNAFWVYKNHPHAFWSLVAFDITITSLALVGVYHIWTMW